MCADRDGRGQDRQRYYDHAKVWHNARGHDLLAARLISRCESRRVWLTRLMRHMRPGHQGDTLAARLAVEVMASATEITKLTGYRDPRPAQ
jgi:hypothetical protein